MMNENVKAKFGRKEEKNVWKKIEGEYWWEKERREKNSGKKYEILLDKKRRPTIVGKESK